MEAQSQVEDIDFGKYWLVLKRHWIPAGGVFLLVLLLTAIAVALQKPVYEAQGKILFRKRDTTSALLTEGTGKIGELESLNQQNTPVDTEAEVLRSIPLIEKTIAALNLKDKDGKPLDPEKALKSLTAKAIKGTDVLLVSYKSADPKESADFVNQLIKTYLDSNILVNRTETTAAREFITQQLPRTEAELRQAEINLRNFKEQNGVVGLKAESEAIINSIAASNNQIATVQAQLSSTSAQINELYQKLRLGPDEAMSLSALRQSPGVQKALSDLQQLESQLAVQHTRYQDSSPVIIKLQEKRASLKALLENRIHQLIGDQRQIPSNIESKETEPVLTDKLIENLINNEVARMGLSNQLNSLAKSQRLYQERANALPQIEQKLQELERKVETSKSNYELLVKRFQDVQIAENQNVGNARVVAGAIVPDKPVASKKKLILLGGFIAGGLLFVMTAFVLDLADPSVKTAKELREIFGYPWLGLLPLTQKPIDDLGVYTSGFHVGSSSSLVGEAYRMLYSNLKFLSPNQPLRAIVITSSISKEGKSTVSANLALCASQLGQKVLLVDADLHHPVQHCFWNLTNAIGLSELLVNSAIVKEAIQPIQENLNVLSSGAIPLNPLAIIDSRQMANLIKEFSLNYDLVIFDTPPLTLVSDTLVLSKMVDGILLVARPGVVDVASAGGAKELLMQSKQEILGLAINGALEENETAGYFRHSKIYHKTATDSESRSNLSKRLLALNKFKGSR
jgi:capsular exopolysaccharide synthesis family protein